jgi:hypothetical protein
VRQLKPNTEFIVEKWSCEGVPSKTGEAHNHLQTEGIYEVDGEAPERSLARKILNGPLTLPRSWFKGGPVGHLKQEDPANAPLPLRDLDTPIQQK